MAILVQNIPANRFHSIDGSKPEIGDKVKLDQGFTFEDGKLGCLVHSFDECGDFKYEAEVYESELSERLNAVMLTEHSELNKVKLDKGL